MKITRVPTPPQRPDRSTVPFPRGTRARILRHLQERPDEAFSASDCGEIAKALGVPLSTVRQELWTLARDGFAAKVKLNRGVWYGSHQAIKKLISAARAEGISIQRP